MKSSERTAADGLKLIYVLGFARSGSTILGNLLGELDGIVHVGELCRMWMRAVLSKDRCGCGSSMETCALWSRVMASTFSRLTGDASEAPTLENHFALVWNTQKKAEAGDKAALRSYAQLMEELLHSVGRISGARVVIDSSKRSKPGAYLKYMESITPYFLHLIRDSRGAVFSRQRRFAHRNGGKLILNPLTTSADCLRWMNSNLAAGSLRRAGGNGQHLTLRYEDFVSQPEATLRRIAEWVGEPIRDDRLPLVGDRIAKLGPNHTVSGNRNRFESGEVPLVLDDRWKVSLQTRDYLLITALTSPLLSKYGYPMHRDLPASTRNDHLPRA